LSWSVNRCQSGAVKASTGPDLWRVAEDDPDSDLYAESSQATTVIAYIHAHSRDW
jgi:hypothetical protein